MLTLQSNYFVFSHCIFGRNMLWRMLMVRWLIQVGAHHPFHLNMFSNWDLLVSYKSNTIHKLFHHSSQKFFRELLFVASSAISSLSLQIHQSKKLNLKTSIVYKCLFSRRPIPIFLFFWVFFFLIYCCITCYLFMNSCPAFFILFWALPQHHNS